MSYPKLNSNVSTQLDKHRPIRFLGGLVMLGLTCLAATAIGPEVLGIPWFVSLGIYLCYLTVQAFLLCWLVGILFRQHEMRKYRIGIGGMLLITTMIALPLGASSIYRAQSVFKKVPAVAEAGPGGVTDITQREESVDGVIIVLNVIMYFAVLPLLIVFEAVLIWAVAIRNRKRPIPA